MAKVKIGGACLNQIPFDWEHNKKNILAVINQAKADAIDLLCLPELCITGYGCEDMFLSEWLPPSALKVLLDILPECHHIAVAIGLPLAFEGKLYNAVCLVQDTEIKGFYCKQILANDGVHYEPRWFSPWRAQHHTTIEIEGRSYPIGDVLFDCCGEKVGFEICEDAWHEDRRPARFHKERGATFILNPSASHFAFDKAAFREKLVSISSKEYQCTYIYTNLLGNEAGRMVYDGDIIFANQGNVILRNKRLSFQEYNLQSLTLDTTSTQESLSLEPLSLVKEEEFTQACSLALFDYLRKSKSQAFVLSLSGGADSSTCAVLVAEMMKRARKELGDSCLELKMNHIDVAKLSKSKELSNMLICAYQGTRNSSEDTFLAAEQLAQQLGATFHHWEIDREVVSYTAKVEQALGRTLAWSSDDIALQNIQARARSPIIWMFANIHNALLLTTSNRSEGDVGYTTMDGDTSGSIAPIAGVDKHFVRNWLLWAEKELGYDSLSFVNALQPTAELRPQDLTQTDEKDLMPYELMLRIERLAIKEKKSPKEIISCLNKVDGIEEYVSKFFRLWSRNQWKRERIAPSFHLDEFNIDPRTWCRFPILNSGVNEY